MITKALTASTADEVLADLGPLHVVYVESEGWISAQILEFPSAISQGRTVDEARELIRDALRGVLATMLAEGWPIEPVPVVEVETIRPAR